MGRRVDRVSRISILKHRYQVGRHLAGEAVTIESSNSLLHVSHNGVMVATHARRHLIDDDHKMDRRAKVTLWVPKTQTALEEAIAGFSERKDIGGEAKALGRLALVLRNQGRTEQGRSLAVRAAELLQQQDPGKRLAYAYGQRAFFDSIAGSLHEALVWANRALDVAQSHDEEGSDDALASVLEVRGCARCDLGDVGGLEDLKEAIRVNEAVGEEASTIIFMNNLADLTWLIEGPGKGVELDRKASGMAYLRGQIFDAHIAEQGALPMLFELGQWTELLERADGLIAWSKETGATQMRSIAAFEKARVLLNRTAVLEPSLLDADLLHYFREMDEVETLAPCLALAALLSSYRENRAAVLDLSEEFTRSTEDTIPYRARYLPDIVRALCAIGNLEHAERLLVQESDVAFARDRHAVITAQAIVAEASGEQERALDLFTDAARRWDEYGFVLEEGQALLGAARCLLVREEELMPFPLFKMQEQYSQSWEQPDSLHKQMLTWIKAPPSAPSSPEPLRGLPGILKRIDPGEQAQSNHGGTVNFHLRIDSAHRNFPRASRAQCCPLLQIRGAAKLT